MKASLVLLVVAFIVSAQPVKLKSENQLQPITVVDTLSVRLDSDQIQINKVKVDYSKSYQDVNIAIDSLVIKTDK